jgi:uncharacterized protein YkwD
MTQSDDWEPVNYHNLPHWMKRVSKPKQWVNTTYTKIFYGKPYDYKVEYSVVHGKLRINYWRSGSAQDALNIPSKCSSHRQKNYLYLLIFLVFLGVCFVAIMQFTPSFQAIPSGILTPTITNAEPGITLAPTPTPIITPILQPTLPRATLATMPTEHARVVQTTTDSGSLSSSSPDSAALEKRIHTLINQQRNSNGLFSLSFDPSLAAIARGHSQDMAKNNYFSHVNLQGLDPAARGNQQGYPCRKDYGSYYTYGIAENIFETSHWTTYNGIRVNDFESLEIIATKTVDGWMSSPGHRQNILTSTYDREGIGVGVGSDNTVYITEDFC